MNGDRRGAGCESHGRTRSALVAMPELQPEAGGNRGPTGRDSPRREDDLALNNQRSRSGMLEMWGTQRTERGVCMLINTPDDMQALQEFQGKHPGIRVKVAVRSGTIGRDTYLATATLPDNPDEVRWEAAGGSARAALANLQLVMANPTI